MAAGLLLVGSGLAASAFAGPAGVGDCEVRHDPMTNMDGWMGHPCTQTRPGPSNQVQMMVNGVMTTVVTTPEGHFPAVDPFDEPPGSNFLMTVYENLYDFNGDEMPNTLPSTPTNPYNLHDGPVLTTPINLTNPDDDLDAIIDALEHAALRSGRVDDGLVARAIDILEGNPIADRAYSGFPLLHYTGPNKIRKVEPILDADGQVVGGNVDVNLIYFDQHIEGDTAFVDPSEVQEVPWTITYHVNILNRGMEDFSPMIMNFDRVGPNRGPFHASMDQSYFPMLNEGTRYTVKIKQNKGKYYNLTYIWGWRIHPPRVQVIENALKRAGPENYTLPEWEKAAFCAGGALDTDCDPVGNPAHRAYAIAQIGDLAPAKRMWNLFRSLRGDDDDDDHGQHKEGRHHAKGDLKATATALREAYLDWKDRTKLPTGVEADPDATITLLYVNNTLYGSRQGLTGEGSGLGPASFKGILNGGAPDWHKRPYNYKVTLLNGDHFMHGYMNVDFGGSRGWENHFQYTDPTTADSLVGPHTGPTVIEGRRFTVEDHVITALEDKIFPINRGGTEEFLQPSPRNADDPVNGNPQLGSGCFFTFGRNHSWPNAGGPWGGIGVMPVAADGTPGMHKVEITYNYEPSTRLRIYQFDPLHHDVAVYSLH